MTQHTTTFLLAKSIELDTVKRHLENMIGALSEFLDKEENRDEDTVREFVAAVKFMNGHGMTYKAIELQTWLENQ